MKFCTRTVLVNGGINDLGAFTIFQPFFPTPRVRAGAEQYCYVGMKALLGRVVRTFPNATVVVTGYFPLITRRTPPDMLFQPAHGISYCLLVAGEDVRIL